MLLMRQIHRSMHGGEKFTSGSLPQDQLQPLLESHLRVVDWLTVPSVHVLKFHLLYGGHVASVSGDRKPRTQA